MPDVEHTYGTASNSLASVQVEFDLGVPRDAALVRVDDKVEQLRSWCRPCTTPTGSVCCGPQPAERAAFKTGPRAFGAPHWLRGTSVRRRRIALHALRREIRAGFIQHSDGRQPFHQQLQLALTAPDVDLGPVGHVQARGQLFP